MDTVLYSVNLYEVMHFCKFDLSIFCIYRQGSYGTIIIIIQRQNLFVTFLQFYSS